MRGAAPPASQPTERDDGGAGQAGGAPSGKADNHPFPRGAREKEFSKILGDAFKTRATDHFVVFYDADEKIVKDFIQRVERTYDSVHRFAVHMNIRLTYPPEKLPVIFCGTNEVFLDKCKKLQGRTPPERAGGLYLQGPNASIFYDVSQFHYMKEAAEKARSAREVAKSANDAATKRQKLWEAQWYENSSLVYQRDENRSLVQHELAHQLLYNLGVHCNRMTAQDPQWLVEGMATIFEPPPGKNGAGFNVVNQRRLGDIREKMRKASVDEIRNFIASPSADHSMLSDEGYARSWAICYYLVKRKAKQLPGYLEVIRHRDKSRRTSPEQDLTDFEKAFGKINDDFIKDLKNFIAKLPYLPRR